MKIAVSTSKGGLKDDVCPLFGRCPTFTIVTIEGKSIKKTEIMPNPGDRAGGGAGVVAAQAVIDAGVESVITGNCGPNALAVLLQAIVKVYASTGTVEDSVKDMLAGKLSALSAPTASDHFGQRSGRGRGFRGGMQ